MCAGLRWSISSVLSTRSLHARERLEGSRAPRGWRSAVGRLGISSPVSDGEVTWRECPLCLRSGETNAMERARCIDETGTTRHPT